MRVFLLAAGALTTAAALMACNGLFGIEDGVLADAASPTDGTIGVEAGDGTTPADGGPDQASGDSGEAEAAPSCGPSTCSGCCNAAGNCVKSPAEAGVCGAAGNTCATCGTGSSCTDGICLGCTDSTVILGGATGDPNVQGFPSSLALSGTNLLVGASQSSSGAGSAYFFAQSGSAWNYVATVNPTSGVTNFGGGAAMSGSVAMVSGTQGYGPQVFVFNQVGASWFNGPVITPPSVDAGYAVAPALALDGTTAIIGSSSGTSPATAYVLSGTSWTLQGTLTPGEAVPDIYSGGVVGLSGDTAIVGASSTDTQGNTAHWADVFVRTGTAWAQQATLAPQGIQANNNPHFQFSVAISGDMAAIAWNGGGYVYLRSGSTWTQQATTEDAGLNVLPSPLDNDFGSSMVASPGALFVGDTAGYNGGTAFLFGLAGTQWLQFEPTFLDAGGGEVNFGTSVARSGRLVALGSPGSSQFVPQGAVSIYTCSP